MELKLAGAWPDLDNMKINICVLRLFLWCSLFLLILDSHLTLTPENYFGEESFPFQNTGAVFFAYSTG